MSFSRQQYDSCAYETAIKQSTDVGKYMYNEPRPCKSCFLESPSIRSQSYGGAICSDKSLIDVDSELLGLNVKNTKCPSKEFTPLKGAFCTLKKEPDCGTNSFLNVEDTRLSNPPCVSKAYTVNRWEFLPCDPQDHVFNLPPFERLANSQIMAKDNHRACIPTIMDQSKSLPKESFDNAKVEMYNFKAMPAFKEHNNLRTCQELQRL